MKTLEKFTNLNPGIKKYFFQTSWNMLGRVVSMIVGFLVTAYVVRYLGPERNGQLVYAATVISFLTFVAGFGIDSLLYRDLVAYPEKRDRLLGTAFIIKSIGSLITMFLLVAALFFLENSSFTKLLLIILWLPLVFQGFNVINYYFQANIKSKKTTINYLIVTFLMIILKISFVNMELGIIWFAFLAFAEIVFYTIGYIVIYKREGLKISDWEFDFFLAKSLILSSWPLIISAAFTIIYSRVDQLMINHYFDFSSVGVYDAGVKISELWYFFPNIVVGSLFPAIVNIKKTGDVERYKKRLVRLYSLMIYMSLIVILPITLLSSQIINFLYGPAFMEAVVVMRIYIWAGVSVSIATVINYYLINENHTKLLFLLNFLSMLTNVILNLYLIPRYGIGGAALATLISYFFSVLGVVFFKKTRGQLNLIGRAIMLKI